MKKFFLLFAFVLSSAVLLKANSTDIHPYHVGSVEIKYNEKAKTFEVTGKFFLDDLENALSKKYGKSLRFLKKTPGTELNIFLEKYFAEYFKLKADNKMLKVKFLGYEEDREAVFVYLESETLPQPSKVETSVSLLYNQFDDQLNLIHIIVNGERKSSKLGYPDRYLYQNF